MLELPAELWFRVSHFIPDDSLFPLASVNRFFLDIVIDRKFRQLTIDDDQPSALIYKLNKLQGDSSIAARVRSLTIHPKAVRSACLRFQKLKGNRSWLQKDQHAFRLVYMYKNPLHILFDAIPSLRGPKVPVEEDGELGDQFLDALSHLHAIQEYAIDWKFANDTEAAFCIPLLVAIWPLHHSNLQILKLDLMLRHLCQLVSSVTNVDHVREVVLHFTSINDDSKECLEQLAAFLNKLSQSLQSLSLSAIGHLDFSCLYSSLTYFPHLSYLSLLLPCDPRHITDPTGFNDFLRTHREVEHLHFSPQHCCYHPHPHDLTHDHQGILSAEDWLERAFLDVSFQNLHTLSLGLNISVSGGKRVISSLPRMTFAAANSVHKMAIVGSIVSLEDLRVLLQPLAFSKVSNPGTRRYLQSFPRGLVLEVHVLDAKLLDLLANLLPGLEVLDLTYRWVDHLEGTNPIDLANHLKDRKYSQWNLSQLVLRCSRQDDEARWPCQQAISRCVPGLRNSV